MIYRMALPLLILLSVGAGAVSAAPFMPHAPEGVLSDGDTGAVIEDLATALDEARTNEALHELESALRNQGAYAKVLRWAPALASVRPENRQLHHMHALALAIAGRETEARELLATWPIEDDDAWGALAMALVARNEGALDRARMLAARALALDERNAYAHNVAGTIALAGEELAEASRYFARAAELSPESAAFHSNLGATYLRLGDLESARTALSSAVDLDPDSCASLVNLAAVSRAEGDAGVAAQQLLSCLSHQPGDRHATRALVEILLEQRALDDADAVMEQHGQALPESAELRARIALMRGDAARAAERLAAGSTAGETNLLKAFVAGAQGDWETAQRLAAAVAEAHPGDLSAVVARAGFTVANNTRPAAAAAGDYPTEIESTLAFFDGLGAARAGDANAMRARLNAADGMLTGVSFRGIDDTQMSRLLRSPATAHLGAGLTYYAWQYYPLAARMFGEAVAAEPRLAIAHILYALASAQLGQAHQVQASLDSALRLAPSSYSANLLRAELHLSRGELADALPLLETAVGVHPEPGLIFRSGLVAEALGEEDKARASYEEFVRLQPDSYMGLNQLAWSLAARGESLDRALALASRADELRPGNASILDTIGWIHYLRGEHQAAVGFLGQAHEISGGTQPLIAFHFAQAQVAAGDRAAARVLLEQLAAAGPQAYDFSPEVRELLRTLD